MNTKNVLKIGIKHCFTIKPCDFGIKTEKDKALLCRRYEEARQKKQRDLS